MPDRAMEAALQACAELRRLPQQRWLQPPMPPMGARNPSVAPTRSGETVEQRVRLLIGDLMARDAAARGVIPFTPDVGVFALPDVLQVLLRSRAAQTTDATELASVASVLRSLL